MALIIWGAALVGLRVVRLMTKATVWTSPNRPGGGAGEAGADSGVGARRGFAMERSTIEYFERVCPLTSPLSPCREFLPGGLGYLGRDWYRRRGRSWLFALNCPSFGSLLNHAPAWSRLGWFIFYGRRWWRWCFNWRSLDLERDPN